MSEQVRPGITRYNGRELNEVMAISALERKGCKVANTAIDITKARGLGNGSWGCVSYLVRFRGFYVTGMDEYAHKNQAA